MNNWSKCDGAGQQPRANGHCPDCAHDAGLRADGKVRFHKARRAGADLDPVLAAFAARRAARAAQQAG